MSNLRDKVGIRTNQSISIINASFPNKKREEVTRHIIQPKQHNQLITNILQRSYKVTKLIALCFFMQYGLL